MMTQTHGVTGIAVWMSGDTLTRALDLNHPYYVTLAGALIAWVAAKAPDIDTPDSRPGRLANRLIPGISDLINSVFGHRGLTHWASTGIIIGVTLGALSCLVHPSLWWTGLAVTTGWIVHIAGDCCTHRGAPVYGPFRRTPVRLPYGYRIECGGTTETWVIYPMSAVCALTMSIVSVTLAVSQ
jgi:inner membrane protein